GRRGHTAGGEVRHRQLAGGGHGAYQFERCAERFCLGHQLVRGERREPLHVRDHGAHVAHGLDHVAGAGLALGADHRRALADAAECFAQVAAAAHERHPEVVLPDVVRLVGGRQHLGLVNEVDLERLQDLRLDDVPDPALRHDRDVDRLLDLLDHRRVAHARHAAVLADLRRDALERHHRGGARLLRDLGLLGVHHVHDHAALQHLGETHLQPERLGAGGRHHVPGRTVAVPTPGRRGLLRALHDVSSSLATARWLLPRARSMTHTARSISGPASARRRSTSSGVTSPIRATSSSVVSSPSEKRTLACASSASSPMASSTWLGPVSALLHALPVETSMPAWSSSCSNASPSTPAKHTFTMPPTRRFRSPFRRVFGTPASRPASSCSPSPVTRCGTPLTSPSRACRAATPIPTIAATFSVPARRPRSCLPPWIWDSSRVRRRTNSAAAPCGPWNLCAATLTRSACQPSTAIAILPGACMASTWNSAPHSLTSGPSASSGWMTPVSLLTAITLTSATSGASIVASSSGSTAPFGRTGMTVSGKPSASSARAVARIEACSIAVVTSRLRPEAARSAPRSARLLDSLPVAVNAISSDWPPTRRATSSRAASIASRAASPRECTLEALPNFSASHGCMAATTSAA